MPEFIVLKVKQDDYTVGKLIENHLYAMYRSDLEFVGFEKEHATKKEHTSISSIWILMKARHLPEIIFAMLRKKLSKHTNIFKTCFVKSIKI